MKVRIKFICDHCGLIYEAIRDQDDDETECCMECGSPCEIILIEVIENGGGVWEVYLEWFFG